MSHSNNWQNDDNSDAAGSPEHNYDTPADSSDSDSDDGAIVLKARITALRIELNILEQQLDKRKRKKARGIASGIAKKACTLTRAGLDAWLTEGTDSESSRSLTREGKIPRTRARARARTRTRA